MPTQSALRNETKYSLCEILELLLLLCEDSDVHVWLTTWLTGTALHKKPISEIRSVTCHMGITLQCLPATRHRWRRPAITPARHAGTRLTYTPEGWKAELILLLVIQAYQDGLPVRRRSSIQVCSNNLIATQSGVDPSNPRSFDSKSDVLTETNPSESDVPDVFELHLDDGELHHVVSAHHLMCRVEQTLRWRLVYLTAAHCTASEPPSGLMCNAKPSFTQKNANCTGVLGKTGKKLHANYTEVQNGLKLSYFCRQPILKSSLG